MALLLLVPLLAVVFMLRPRLKAAVSLGRLRVRKYNEILVAMRIKHTSS